MKLLIVEDDRALNDGIALSLKADAAVMLQAYTLAEARKLLAGEVDLVILDVNLPDGSGLSLCRELRASKRVPAVSYTHLTLPTTP